MSTTHAFPIPFGPHWLASLRPHAPELQFWGYEVGNLAAAMAGAGGLAALWAAMDPQRHGWQAILRDHGDVVVTVGIAAILIWLMGARWIGQRLAPGAALRGVDVLAAGVALGLIALALYQGVTPMTAAAVFFVSGSALLRQADVQPVLLKWGGLLLSGGGAFLVAVGVTGALTALSVFTALTGVSVFFAGLLTYQGGVFVCAGTKACAGPLSRVLAWILDRPIRWTVDIVVMPALFWIPETTKANKPFLTAMWARLPFRLLSAGAALATFTPEGVLFALACLLWALGDVAIGSLDED